MQIRSFDPPIYVRKPLEWLAIVILSPALAVILLAVMCAKAQEWLMGPSWYWRPWFAWHFVDVEGRGTVWLEWVERRSWYSNTLYRTPGDPNAFGAAEGDRSPSPNPHGDRECQK